MGVLDLSGKEPGAFFQLGDGFLRSEVHQETHRRHKFGSLAPWMGDEAEQRALQLVESRRRDPIRGSLGAPPVAFGAQDLDQGPADEAIDGVIEGTLLKRQDLVFVTILKE